MGKRSRLSRNYIKKSRQNLVLSILGIAVTLFILFRYGIPLISDTGFFVSQLGKNSQEEQNTTQKSNFIPAPFLNPIPQATKEQSLKINGNALPGIKVELFLNGSKDNETTANKDGSFEFTVDLSEGENILKARSVSETSKSDFSDQLIVTYQKKDPNLTIDSPHDGDNISGGNQITVSGKTDSQNSVTVNDFIAVIDSTGSWSYSLTLVSGGNEIKVVATDLAGNKTEKIIRINYSP